MMIQYLGYEEDYSARTCIFRVFNSTQPERQFELSAKIPLLKEYQFKIQDLPDLCFSMLKNELSTETDQRVLPLQMTVSANELRVYVEGHYPKKRDTTGNRKPQD
jgi:hypothetical protein